MNVNDRSPGLRKATAKSLTAVTRQQIRKMRTADFLSGYNPGE